MTKNFIFIKILFFFILLSGLTASGSLQAQEKNISGVVTDAADGSPLIGVTVRAKGNTAIGTTTQIQGKFQLKVPDSIQSLLFSYVGYQNKTVAITGTSMQVKLTSGEQLNELVVVGYGTRKAKDVSSAITKLSNDDFNKGVVTNPIQQVQGKVSGLVITQPGGDPNQDISIRMRGQASLTGGQAPLIVLDGVPLDDPNIISNIP
ncbi:MAG TPA: carboxypeptidase-like regulatory domain-containing protein, partial [Chitinophagaceae bacterium]|nr:carboxypeptidase-like regulatory domain-containing protein [Chitinophagaceae bacterium]